MINQEMFREYDIRGLAEKDLSDDVAVPLGKAIGTFLKTRGCKIVTLGHDCRLSSPRIAKAFEASLMSCGLEVWDISLVPTPVSYFSVNSLAVDGGVMITASHNPSEYNGVKISLGKTTIYGQDIQEIKKCLLCHDFVSAPGSSRKIDLKEAYIQKSQRGADGRER